MNKKNLKLFAIIALWSLIFLPAISLATVDPTANLNIATPDEIQKQGSLESLAATIIKIVLQIAGVVLLLLVIYGGAVWGTAGGDSAKVTKAKNIILYAAIGIFIIGASYAITLFILDSLGY